MKKYHHERLQEYIRKLAGCYAIEIKYNQEHNMHYAHYNRIIIMLKKDYKFYDFEHEFAHLKFLTEEGKIKYLYPLEKHYGNKELFKFSNILTNIIYDIYVDSYISANFSIPREYFENKVKIFNEYLNNIQETLDLNKKLIKVIKRAIKEYILVLNKIINDDLKGSIYLSKNSIRCQRDHINRYVSQIGLLDDFEWVTYHTLYIREQKKKGEECANKLA